MIRQNKVPKGLFDSPIMINGITITQLIILSLLMIFFVILSYVFGEYAAYFFLAGAAVTAGVFIIFRLANYQRPGAFEEYLRYMFDPKLQKCRYSGRSKHTFITPR